MGGREEGGGGFTYETDEMLAGFTGKESAMDKEKGKRAKKKIRQKKKKNPTTNKKQATVRKRGGFIGGVYFLYHT